VLAVYGGAGRHPQPAIDRSMKQRPAIQNIAAAIAGNTLEWFDILVYAYFVKAIAANFFPMDNGINSLLLAYGTFGLSFIARPLGAIFLGRLADRLGRRTALVRASALMFLGTLAIAVLPPYSSIGIAAPVMLLAARLVQGFSAGGEFGSATAYLAEQSPHRQAFYSSFQFASQGLGMALAALMGLALATWLSPADMMTWGWRVPFLIGAVAGPVAYILRRNIDETPEYLATAPHKERASRHAPVGFIARCLVGSCAVLACTVSIYFLVFIPGFAQTSLHADPAIAYGGALVSGITLLAGTPLAGLLADRFGPLRIGALGAVLIVLTSYPVFSVVVAAVDERSILLGLFVHAIVTALYLGALPAILANLFNTHTRSLGLAISYNLAVMIAGGFAQMIFVLLIEWTGTRAAPSFYVTFAGAASLFAVLVCRRMTLVDLNGAAR
jgi:MHS family proline/betaine transporter-like MFS transporter